MSQKMVYRKVRHKPIVIIIGSLDFVGLFQGTFGKDLGLNFLIAV